MTPRQRVEALLLGRNADRVPFTVYEGKLPQCQVEREMRNDGLCLVRRLGVSRTESPGVKEHFVHFHEKGKDKIRRHILTPAGELTSVMVAEPIDSPGGVSHWREEHIFKGPDDYRAVESLIRSRRHSPDYTDALQAGKHAGGDVIVRGGIGYEPLQEIIVEIMGVETFSREWMENRDAVLALRRALVEERRVQYRIAAESPLLHFNYGGNVIPEVTGPEVFEKYILPDYREFAQIMHGRGKLVGTHLDGNNRRIADRVAKADLDYIEAFSPSPATDMSLADAYSAWPGMLLWINFPAPILVRPEVEVRDYTLQLLGQTPPDRRLIVGITEDVPERDWRRSFRAILDTLNGNPPR